ncbi:hypothetical protein HGB25_00550 [Candidatus Saccharibacteria bacterium]|nr:hypothetical protein [Candidatus Saccharibacteria bacterium]
MDNEEQPTIQSPAQPVPTDALEMHESRGAQPIEPAEAEPRKVELAEQQVQLADVWAELYSRPDYHGHGKSAEVILRNPSVYLGDIDASQLPQDLQDRWLKFMTQASECVAISSTIPMQPDDKTGLNRLKDLVENENVRTEARPDVAKLVVQASRLFADSVQHVPGATDYYQKNVEAAAASLQLELETNRT